MKMATTKIGPVQGDLDSPKVLLKIIRENARPDDKVALQLALKIHVFVLV
jgi:hypothetical protein